MKENMVATLKKLILLLRIQLLVAVYGKQLLVQGTQLLLLYNMDTAMMMILLEWSKDSKRHEK
jgi:hypothetical protein